MGAPGRRRTTASFSLPSRSRLHDHLVTANLQETLFRRSPILCSYEALKKTGSKMANKILLVFIGFDIAFLLCAVLHLLIPLYTRASVKNNMNVNNIASNLLLDDCPLTASEINAIIMFLTFLLSVPALFMQRNRVWLKVHVAGVIVAALMTLSIGLAIWYSTLEVHKNLTPVWMNQSSNVQSMLQHRNRCTSRTLCNPVRCVRLSVPGYCVHHVLRLCGCGYDALALGTLLDQGS